MSDTFTAAQLEAFRGANTVRIETHRPMGRPIRETIIWLVVDATDRVLVRSVRGHRGRWYRELLGDPAGAVIVGSSRIQIRAEHANDADRVEACSAALTLKYARSGASLAAMLAADVLDDTLELHPA